MLLKIGTDSFLMGVDVVYQGGIFIANRDNSHCVKSVRIRSYSGPHFHAFGLNMERYGVSLRIQYECGKMRTRITPNKVTFCKGSHYKLGQQILLQLGPTVITNCGRFVINRDSCYRSGQLLEISAQQLKLIDFC